MMTLAPIDASDNAVAFPIPLLPPGKQNNTQVLEVQSSLTFFFLEYSYYENLLVVWYYV